MSNPELLKVQLKIKRQLEYLQGCLANCKADFPDNKEAINSWSSMVHATEICLLIANGEEI